jgi:hypothetical protein
MPRERRGALRAMTAANTCTGEPACPALPPTGGQTAVLDTLASVHCFDWILSPGTTDRRNPVGYLGTRMFQAQR